MAVPGFSGSDGGIGKSRVEIKREEIRDINIFKESPIPLDISYFVNNVCNLKCKHCYVGYNVNKGTLSAKEWKDNFDALISMGALTFGNVGREPTLEWDTSLDLLTYFKEKRESNPKIRFGLVTNGTLLDKTKINDLERLQPDYIDISIDGIGEIHDYIRGSGNFRKTIDNINEISKHDVFNKIFIIYTINKKNILNIAESVEILYGKGLNKILFSPYVTLDKRDELYISDGLIVKAVEKLVSGKLIDFSKFNGLEIYIKNDYTTTYNIMEKLSEKEIIDKNNLLIDEYGVIFSKNSYCGNNVYFNYIPWDNTFTQSIRISHDGYVSNCYDMFFRDYPERAIGNVKKQPIEEILQSQQISISKAANT
jgi:sulfatase maturation enzyme AslB (radical SAM superfamily)